MGKKNDGKHQKKKLTKKELKHLNHLKLMEGKKSGEVTTNSFNSNNQNTEYKKAA